jgi:hypothetical protein
VQQFVDLARHGFDLQSSYISPGDALLTYREPGYWSQQTDEKFTSVIVVRMICGNHVILLT